MFYIECIIKTIEILQNREINDLGTKNVKKWPKPSFASKIFTGAMHIQKSPLVA